MAPLQSCEELKLHFCHFQGTRVNKTLLIVYHIWSDKKAGKSIRFHYHFEVISCEFQPQRPRILF